jgi:hypothetical protein
MTISSKIKSLFFTFLMLATTTIAVAGERCLENASNRDLINELDRRLDNAGGNGGSSNGNNRPFKDLYALSFDRVQESVVISVQSYLNGEKSTYEYKTDTTESAASLLERLNNVLPKINSSTKAGNILAACFFIKGTAAPLLVKVMLTRQSGIKFVGQTSYDAYRSYSKCLDDADQINQQVL